MKKLFILSSLLGGSLAVVLPEASYDSDFKMLPAAHPSGA